ncbi:dynein light chain Tctex-type 1-like [Centruroides vittatus]|uniref:dynein light chain Tctex-type 1-like n=1 Tax=Centruroides vittatus TaxID=120091 RepID=UPI003510A919
MSEEEATNFDKDEIKPVIKDAIETVIGNNIYQQNMIDQWMNNIHENILGQLIKLNKPLKYIVITVVVQRTGSGLHTTGSCYWDETTDGCCMVIWENDTIQCVSKVYVLGF